MECLICQVISWKKIITVLYDKLKLIIVPKGFGELNRSLTNKSEQKVKGQQ